MGLVLGTVRSEPHEDIQEAASLDQEIANQLDKLVPTETKKEHLDEWKNELETKMKLVDKDSKAETVEELKKQLAKLQAEKERKELMERKKALEGLQRSIAGKEFIIKKLEEKIETLEEELICPRYSFWRISSFWTPSAYIPGKFFIGCCVGLASFVPISTLCEWAWNDKSYLD